MTVTSVSSVSKLAAQLSPPGYLDKHASSKIIETLGALAQGVPKVVNKVRNSKVVQGRPPLLGNFATNAAGNTMGAVTTFQEPATGIYRTLFPLSGGAYSSEEYGTPEQLQATTLERFNPDVLLDPSYRSQLNLPATQKVKDLTPEQLKAWHNAFFQNARKMNWNTFLDNEFSGSLPHIFAKNVRRLGTGYAISQMPGLNRHTTETMRDLSARAANYKALTNKGFDPLKQTFVNSSNKIIGLTGAMAPKATLIGISSAPDLLLAGAEAASNASDTTKNTAEAAGELKRTMQAIKNIAENQGAQSANNLVTTTGALGDTAGLAKTTMESLKNTTDAVNKVTEQVAGARSQIEGSKQMQSLANAADSFGSFMKQMQLYAPAIAAGVGLTGMYALYKRMTARDKKKTKEASAILTIAQQAALSGLNKQAAMDNETKMRLLFNLAGRPALGASLGLFGNTMVDMADNELNLTPLSSEERRSARRRAMLSGAVAGLGHGVGREALHAAYPDKF